MTASPKTTTRDLNVIGYGIKSAKVTETEDGTPLTAVVVIDLTGDYGPSMSGKTNKIAGTVKSAEVDALTRLTVNVYRYPEPRTKAA
jgi:hypothetical protein